MKSILVVDDEKHIRESLEGVLKDEGYEVSTAETAEEAISKIEVSLPDLILLDIWLPGKDGVEALRDIKSSHKDIPVVMISGHGTVETAVRATKFGAYDFLEKPLSLDKVVLTVEHALEEKRLRDESTALLEKDMQKYSIIGASEPISKLLKDIRRVAPTNSWALITGENGTGKELVARNIFLFSNRANKPFVAVNCAAIPEDLIESELFGYEKGAFTGAHTGKKGKFDLADGGTLFLDEIGDMSLKTQAKILRILEEQSFERVGGTRKIKVDVRVLAATNKNLEDEIKNGNFREDLYYRLNVIPLHVAPLRERVADIPLFAERFLTEFSLETKKEPFEIDKNAMDALMAYRWPGNVRELRNLMERLVIMSPTHNITVEDLPPHVTGNSGNGTAVLFSKDLLKEARGDFEREFIIRKLAEFGGNVPRTAEAIGIERSHLYRKIKMYGIEV